MNSSVGQGQIDEWYSRSVDTIAFLQNEFKPYEWWIVQSSHFGDNREAFTFFFPVIAGFMNVLGVRALWAAILSEWSNLILKWVIKGDRPYWWVHQTSFYSNASRPDLRQFPNTCETGPGTPSGHIMMNVALFYVFCRGMSKYYIRTSKKFKFSQFFLSSLLYFAYALWISLIFVSRLYIQTHFIHQCVFGVFFGLIVGHIAWSSKWLVKSHNFGSTVFANLLVGSSLMVYGFLQSKGVDPLWSVPLAFKYCSNADFVQVETMPYFSMVRFAAMALGIGFSVSSKKRRNVQAPTKGFLRTILTIKAGVLLGKVLTLSQAAVPKDDLIVYLSVNFFLQLLFPYVIIALIPYVLYILYPISK